MSKEFAFCAKSCKFVFDEDGTFNVFNLLRLFKNHNQEEINLDISYLDYDQQVNVLSKIPNFLELYSEVISKSAIMASVKCSKVNESLIVQIGKKFKIEDDICFEDNKVTFDVGSCKNLTNKQDPHLVKNVRGAALLSLVQDLIEIKQINNTFSIFDVESPIFLHAANEFLYNKENAKMVWNVLVEWERTLDDKTEINKKISFAEKEAIKINKLINIAKNSSIENSDFSYLYNESIVKKIGIEDSFYRQKTKINLWFVDDQHANGWSRLLERIISVSMINMECVGSVVGVSAQIELATIVDKSTAPDLALVDLRLSDSDNGVELYNADDLSGFKVVEMLLSQWAGLPIMIASASNKLWNMEKAIQKGAVSYWRKSDEVIKESSQKSILTAFDIYIQFTEKLSTLLNKMKYRNIFIIVEKIREELSTFGPGYSSFKLVIENYFKDLDQKTSWMCWRKEDDENIIDALYLGVNSIFNELENFLWNKSNNTLILLPNNSVRNISQNADSLIINDTLSHIDDKYDLKGRALESYYEYNKGIRNKLPNIHGSISSQDVKHANIIDIESSLLIVLCVLHELKVTNNHN